MVKLSDKKFNIIETSYDEQMREYERKYQGFKQIWIEHPDITKKEAYKMMGIPASNCQKGLRHYINDRLAEDGLPVNHYNFRWRNSHGEKTRRVLQE